MKKLFVLVLALCLFALPALAMADEATLTVVGNATVTIVPDYAKMVIGANTTGDTVEAAALENSKTIENVIAALKALGLTNEDISTSSFNVYPRYDYNSAVPTVNGYQVEHMLNVRVNDVAAVGAALDAAMKAGANQSYGVNFLSTKSGEASDEALEKAIAEGMRKAELAAKAAGKTLGNLKAISEADVGYSPIYNTTEKAAMDTAGGTQLQAGNLEVSAAVTITYELK